MKRSFLSILTGILLTFSLSREVRAGDDSALRSLVGVVADTYGAFQAAEFVASLFGVGAGPSMTDAINELETFMMNYRDQAW